jgi:predicted nucleotidyltransferase
MVLKPQDVLVVLKLVAMGQKPWSYAWLAVQLGMSPSQLHSAVKRALAAQLAVRKGDEIVPHIRNLEEFLVHGLKYVFVPEQGEMTRGIPTGYAAPPLNKHFASAGEPSPVWPDAQGDVRGSAFSPLYSLAPRAARSDPQLYELLVLVDAIRGGRAREREIAIMELSKRLGTATEQEQGVTTDNEDRLVIGRTIVVSRAALREVTQHYHIRRLVLFGSAARGELKPDSDIDLLVEFESGQAPSLGGMVEIREAFAKLFGGRKVDIATPAILNNPYRRRAIERDMEELYAA